MNNYNEDIKNNLNRMRARILEESYDEAALAGRHILEYMIESIHILKFQTDVWNQECDKLELKINYLWQQRCIADAQKIIYIK